MQLKFYEEAKSTLNLSTEDIAPSKEAEKPKESFLEHENPQYTSDISPMINTEKPSQLIKFDRCDFVNVYTHHKSINHNHLIVNTATLKTCLVTSWAQS